MKRTKKPKPLKRGIVQNDISRCWTMLYKQQYELFNPNKFKRTR